MTLFQSATIDHHGVNLAYARQPGRAPTLVWLGGFKSDMTGTKANALATWAAGAGCGFLRFDYAGHGRSGGRFEDFAISDWAEQSVAVIDQLSEGPLVLVGSSMGAWLALLAARQRPERVAGLLLIAPAADFTERLMWPNFSDAVRRQIEAQGRWERPSAYDPEPYVTTKRLIEDGRTCLIMDAPYPFAGPVRILQGGDDPDVPAAHARALADLIQCPDLRFDLIPDGDHRLSRPEDIEKLTTLAGEMAALLAPKPKS
jgi:hypothetical protein